MRQSRGWSHASGLWRRQAASRLVVSLAGVTGDQVADVERVDVGASCFGFGEAAVALCAVAILAMGPTRVRSGSHVVSDALAGYLFGAGWLLALAATFGRTRRGIPLAGVTLNPCVEATKPSTPSTPATSSLATRGLAPTRTTAI